LGGCLAGAALTLSPLTAQHVTFTTADGSRFVLLPDATVPHVHWSTASPADGSDDPPGLPGLARTVVKSAVHGTWRTGSRDLAAEQKALDALDEAWQRRLANPTDQSLDAAVVAAHARADELADDGAFLRALAAAPAHAPAITFGAACATVTVTTIEAGLPEVARLLLERREEQALRAVLRTWNGDLFAHLQQTASDPWHALHREALALLLPTSPALRHYEPPVVRAPRRQEALDTWARSQHPERTVHVLVGDFDAASVQTLCERVFVRTALPRPPARPAPASIPLTGPRRSTVPGAPGMVTFAWPLPAGTDADVAETTARWLVDDPATGLAAALARAGVQGAKVASAAPWPAAADGALLRLDVHAAGSGPKLVDVVLRLVAEAAKAKPDAASLAAIDGERLSAWCAATQDAAQLAAHVAERSLVLPPARAVAGPRAVTPAELQAVVAAALRGHPAIVEGRP
jgi:predicted Zn-dependent peptidase